MDSSFLKEQADRCRTLAEKADRFTKRRLLDFGRKVRRQARPSFARYAHYRDTNRFPGIANSRKTKLIAGNEIRQ